MNNNDERDYEEENFNRVLMEEDLEDDYEIPFEYLEIHSPFKSPGYFEFIDDHYGWDY